MSASFLWEELFYLFLLREALDGLGGIICDTERILGYLFRLILLRGKYLQRSLSPYVPVIVKEYGIIVHESTVIS